MPHYCVAVGCKNMHSKCEYSFHRFPMNESKCKQWEAAVRQDGWCSTKYSRICGAHFVKGCNLSISFVHAYFMVELDINIAVTQA